MLILILVGALLSRKKIITEKGTKDISGILLNVVTPCVLVKAYQIDYNKELVSELLLAFGISVLIHVVFIVAAHLIWRFEKDKNKLKAEVFTTIYSNCGFMGIPLLAATMGDKGVLFGSTYLAMFNVIVWTHGLYLYGGDIKLLSVKNLVKNPGVVGVVVALVLFFAKIKLSGIVMDVVGYFAALNTPLAMLLLGTYLAQSDLKKALVQPGIYVVAFLRLVAFPVAVVLLFKVLGVDKFIATTLTLSAACPAAAISAMFAEKFDYDTGYPSQIVSVTTLLSLATLPLLSLIAELLL